MHLLELGEIYRLFFPSCSESVISTPGDKYLKYINFFLNQNLKLFGVIYYELWSHL